MLAQHSSLCHAGLTFDGTGCVFQLRVGRDYVLRALAIIIVRRAAELGFLTEIQCAQLIIMWAVSLAIVYITVRTTVLGEQMVGGLLAAPATVLFALPAVRQTPQRLMSALIVA